jgi:hypothetical protein
VTTWHNDNCRTGWQRVETNLTATGSVGTAVTQTNFGLVAEWNGTSGNPMGSVEAQPLAVSGLQGVQGQNGQTCSTPCSLVLIEDENDMLWAYNAAPGSPSIPVWSVQLAPTGEGPVNCSSYPDFAPCAAGTIPGGFVGITGTPVIDEGSDMSYAVAAEANAISTPGYYLFAVDILDGTILSSTQINGSVPGKNPYNQQQQSGKCTSSYPANGQTLTFDGDEIQRAALLLIQGTPGTPSTVYVAFAPSGSEWENGWLFGYQYQSGPSPSLQQTEIFATTPYGTGGGIWGSGSGPASDGTYIYTATGNGTWDLVATNPAANDVADSVLKLLPSPTRNTFSVYDYFTPDNVLTYQPQPPSGKVGLCQNDEDVGSGGVLLFPDPFFNGLYLIVSADKQSNLYFENTASLGGYNANSNNNVQPLLTPSGMNNPPNNPYPQTPVQGYWSSPAYWKYLDSGQNTHYYLYYSATVQLLPPPNTNWQKVPYPIYQYVLSTGGLPISSNAASLATPDLFCFHSPTPAISSYGTAAGSGILWAVEHRYFDNPADCGGSDLGSALHAYDATAMTELYNSSITFPNGGLAGGHFAVPTVFQGQVYVGTSVKAYVFGLCSTTPSRKCITNP